MIRFKIIYVSFFLLSVLPGCVHEPAKISHPLHLDAARDVFIHEESGFSFPSKIDEFQRDSGIRFYDEAGNNFSVPYNLLTNDKKAVATIYVYPAIRDYSITPIPALGRVPDWFIQSQYDDAKKAIIETYNARVVSEASVKTVKSILNQEGKKGVFEFDTVSGETVLTELHLFAHNGWLVKYRFSYPSKYAGAIVPRIENFMRSFEWP